MFGSKVGSKHQIGRNFGVYNIVRGLWLMLINPWTWAEPFRLAFNIACGRIADARKTLVFAAVLFGGGIMGGASRTILECVACGRIAADGTVTFAKNVTPAKSATGVYTWTLNQGGVDSLQSIVQFTPETASCIAVVAHTSDTVKTISTFAVDGTTATDKAHAVVIWQVVPA